MSFFSEVSFFNLAIRVPDPDKRCVPPSMNPFGSISREFQDYLATNAPTSDPKAFAAAVRARLVRFYEKHYPSRFAILRFVCI